MKQKQFFNVLILGVIALVFGSNVVNGQYLLQAPNGGGENNYRWYEASDTATVLATDFFFEVTSPGVYFATYDGTLCGSNATGYFIVTNCNSPYNEVTLDIRDNVNGSATVSWVPAVAGDQTQPTVIADLNVTRYTASITKAGNTSELPSFTVVCIDQSANLVDDVVTTDEDTPMVVDIYANDSDLPSAGTLVTTDPPNGSISVNNNGTPNDPTDDIITYSPDPDFKGADTFDYTVCNFFGDCSTATVNITVNPIVDAFDDAIATMEEEQVTIVELANDNDVPSAGTITYTLPPNGTVTMNDGGTPADPSDDTFDYMPNPGFTGADLFDYTICDSAGNCSTATILVMVNPMINVDLDTDDDGIVDSFEDLNLDNDNDPATNPTDSDGDGIADYLDIDSDDDGIPDNVEAQPTEGYTPPSGIDSDGNGLDDIYENGGGLGLIPIDTDGDGLPDYLDSDSDNDGVPDAIEGHDHDADGIPDVTFIGSDKDNDGLDDGYEGATAIDTDVNDEIDQPYDDLPNHDNDVESDYRDSDDDNDGIPTRDEDVNGDGDYTNDDSDSDGRPDYLDNTPAEEIEVFNVITPNGDGIHDVLVIKGIDQLPENTLRIYNRWGVLVYTTNSYNTEGNVFDGTSEGRVTVDQENKLPVGTYFYLFDYKDQGGNQQSMSGYLYINR